MAHYDLSDEPFANMLGISYRQSQRFRSGECPVPDPVAKLVRTVLRHKLAPEDVG